MNETVQIYGPSFSNFVRSVKLVCEEKQLPYENGFALDGEEIPFQSEAHYALHPYGKLPLIRHRGHTLAETVGICRYLDSIGSGPALQPTDPLARAHHDQWCSIIGLYVDQAVIRRFLLEFAFPKGENGQPRLDKIQAAVPDVIKAVNVIEHALGDKEYLCGEQFSIADALWLPMLHYLSELPEDFAALPQESALNQYLARGKARESGQKILRSRKDA